MSHLSYIFFLVVTLSFSSLSFAQSESSTGSKVGSFIYKLKDASPSNQTKVEFLLARYGLKKSNRKNLKNLFLTELNQRYPIHSSRVLAELRRTNLFEFIEEDKLSRPHGISDPLYGSQWHLTQTKAEKAWLFSKGTNTTKVMICDSGINSNHSDLAQQIIGGKNFVDGSNDFSAVNFHGTFAAGVVSALHNNLGVAGVTPGAKLFAGRITNRSDGWAYYSDMAECIQWAADNGAKVVNLSYSGAESPTIDSAAKYLRERGGLLIMSAGNSNADISSSTPDYPSFILTAATDRSNLRASFSNYGTPIDISAPGVDIYSTWFDGSYGSGWGTSFAAPQVAAAAALVWSIAPQMSPADVENLLLSTSLPLGDSYQFGAGLLDLGLLAEEASKRASLPNYIAVQSIGLSLVKNKTSTSARAKIKIVDENGLPVSNARVYFSWSGLTTSSSSAITTQYGEITVTSASTTKKGTFKVTVTNILKSNETYDASKNKVSSAQLSN